MNTVLGREEVTLPMHDSLITALLTRFESHAKYEREVVMLLRQQVHLQHLILRALHQQHENRVLGGVFAQIGDPTMVPIQPGQKPRFQVTPTFSGAPFALDPTKAAISTDDPNAAASIVTDGVNGPADGTVFEIDLAAGITIPAGGLAIAVDWDYTNADGVVAHVTGTLTEQGIVDDVTGGTFAQIA